MLNLLQFLFFSLSFATTPINIPEQYIQQNQHGTFFLFNANGEYLLTDCYISKTNESSHCYFYFEDHDGKKSVYEANFLDLHKAQESLLADLKKLQIEWLKKYPLDSWNASFSLFRKTNHNALAQLITEIETETLPNRIFLVHYNSNFRKETPSFHDSELTLRVWDIFKKYLKFRYQD